MEFPFVDEAARAVLLAAIITAIQRRCSTTPRCSDLMRPDSEAAIPSG
jgi:hypothetical protein